MQPAHRQGTLKGCYMPLGAHHQDEYKRANPDNQCAYAQRNTGNQEREVSEPERERYQQV